MGSPRTFYARWALRIDANSFVAIAETNSVDANAAYGNACDVSAPLLPPKPLSSRATLRQVLAHNIRALRVARGLSQEALALRCDLDRTYVSAVER